MSEGGHSSYVYMGILVFSFSRVFVSFFAPLLLVAKLLGSCFVAFMVPPEKSIHRLRLLSLLGRRRPPIKRTCQKGKQGRRRKNFAAVWKAALWEEPLKTGRKGKGPFFLRTKRERFSFEWKGACGSVKKCAKKG